MKSKFVACLVVLAAGLVALAPAASAQNTDDLIELLRQDLNTEATAIMTEALALDSSQSEIFWPIWREYNLEWSKTGAAQLALLKDYAEHHTTMDDEKAKEYAERGFKIEEQRLKLRKKYWKKVNKELGGIIAARFAQVDRQLTNLVQVQIASQVPLVQAAP
jgi:type II secretory pathway component PulJ